MLVSTFGSSGVALAQLGPYSYAKAISVNSSTGAILLAGEAVDSNSDLAISLVQFNSGGTLDTSFGSSGSIITSEGSLASASALTVLSGGDILVAGMASNSTGPGVALAEYVTSAPHTLTYDNNGNTTKDADGIKYTYDAWNRQVTATPPGDTYHETYYTYNALNNRVSDLDGVVSTATDPVLIINEGNAQTSDIDSLTVVFPTVVTLSTISGTAPFALVNTSNTATSLAWSNPTGDGKTWLITFNNPTQLSGAGSLQDGIYTLTINHGEVSVGGTTLGADVVYAFGRLYGDYFGTQTVNFKDLGLLAQNLSMSSLKLGYLWFLDYDGNQADTFIEIGALAQRLSDVQYYSHMGDIYIGSSATPAPGVIPYGIAPDDLYYSAQGQVIEEDSLNTSFSTPVVQPQDQYVWGAAYQNELVERDQHATTSSSPAYGIAGSGLNERLFTLQDANYNVMALVGLNSAGTSWVVLERYEYDPYGKVTHLSASGATGFFDLYQMQYLFQGERLDSVTGEYDTGIREMKDGTFMEEDPSGAAGSGANLYQFEESNSEHGLDPTGLADALGENILGIVVSRYYFGVALPVFGSVLNILAHHYNLALQR
jgi:RHS repeat-associated protein